MLYEILLALHNVTRWLVIGGMVWALVVVYRDLLRKAPWTAAPRRAGLVFTSMLNVQLILGLLLYFVGPYGTLAFENFSAAVADDVFRFFTVEHPLQMLIAVVVAQVGYTVSKRARTDKLKFRWAAACYSVAALLVLMATPWPLMEHGRPLLPHLG